MGQTRAHFHFQLLLKYRRIDAHTNCSEISFFLFNWVQLSFIWKLEHFTAQWKLQLMRNSVCSLIVGWQWSWFSRVRSRLTYSIRHGLLHSCLSAILKWEPRAGGGINSRDAPSRPCRSVMWSGRFQSAPWAIARTVCSLNSKRVCVYLFIILYIKVDSWFPHNTN